MPKYAFHHEHTPVPHHQLPVTSRLQCSRTHQCTGMRTRTHTRTIVSVCTCVLTCSPTLVYPTVPPSPTHHSPPGPYAISPYLACAHKPPVVLLLLSSPPLSSPSPSPLLPCHHLAPSPSPTSCSMVSRRQHNARNCVRCSIAALVLAIALAPTHPFPPPCHILQYERASACMHADTLVCVRACAHLLVHPRPPHCCTIKRARSAPIPLTRHPRLHVSTLSHPAITHTHVPLIGLHAEVG